MCLRLAGWRDSRPSTIGGGMMSNLFWLTDAQMARLRPYFPKSHGKPRVDDRRVLSGSEEERKTIQ